MTENNDFYKNLLKGKIAEQIIECLFLEAGIQIFKFGYENYFPEILRQNNKLKGEVATHIKQQSDFIFIDNENTLHYLEVKYRKNCFLNDEQIEKYPEFIIEVNSTSIECLNKKDEFPKFKHLREYKEFDNIKDDLLSKYMELTKDIYN